MTSFKLASYKVGYYGDFCCQQGVELVEGYAMRDHIHMLLTIHPSIVLANTIGFLKGKSAIRILGTSIILPALPVVLILGYSSY